MDVGSSLHEKGGDCEVCEVPALIESTCIVQGSASMLTEKLDGKKSKTRRNLVKWIDFGAFVKKKSSN